MVYLHGAHGRVLPNMVCLHATRVRHLAATTTPFVRTLCDWSIFTNMQMLCHVMSVERVRWVGVKTARCQSGFGREIGSIMACHFIFALVCGLYCQDYASLLDKNMKLNPLCPTQQHTVYVEKGDLPPIWTDVPRKVSKIVVSFFPRSPFCFDGFK